MKKLLVFVFSLIFAVAATYAQNTATVTTEGDDNVNSVTQSGSNEAIIDQLANNSDVTVTQLGTDNFARVDQDGKWPVGPVVSESATQYQDGTNLEARIKQQTDSGHGGSSASQTQEGVDHYAKAWQFSWNSSIIQEQYGSEGGNWAEAYQKHYNNSITQIQDGKGNVAAVDEQSGWGSVVGNSASQTQIGNWNHTLIGQNGGDGNSAEVVQSGHDNWAGYGLSGGGQYGIYQTGSMNDAVVTQNDNVNKSEVFQSGYGNEVDVLQNGGAGLFNSYGDYVNKSDVTQTGDNNSTSVTQTFN